MFIAYMIYSVRTPLGVPCRLRNAHVAPTERND